MVREICVIILAFVVSILILCTIGIIVFCCHFIKQGTRELKEIERKEKLLRKGEEL